MTVKRQTMMYTDLARVKKNPKEIRSEVTFKVFYSRTNLGKVWPIFHVLFITTCIRRTSGPGLRTFKQSNALLEIKKNSE
jgi:hypothetical protein